MFTDDWLLSRVDDSLVDDLLTECQKQDASLDLIIVPPFVRFVSPQNDVGLQRIIPGLRRRVAAHCLTRGLIEQIMQTPRLYIPQTAKTIADRIALVRRTLHTLGHTMQPVDSGT